MPGGPIETPAYGNIHGLPRSTCALCGECDLGCNYGAKNTPRPHVPVRRAARGRRHPRPPRGQGLPAARQRRGRRLRGHVRRPHRRRRASPRSGSRRRTIRCERLVLAAGTFGTTYLLLSNRSAFPGLSAALGTRFCGNGDLLGFVIERGATTASAATWLPTPGPVITSAIRVADGVDGATATRGAATTSRTRATRPSPPGSPRPARASARSPGRSSSAAGRLVEDLTDAGDSTPGRRPRRPARARLVDRRARCRCSAWAATSPTA